MSLTDQRAAYDDCYRLYQAAVDSPRGAGVRTTFPTKNQATFFQTRMNKARAIMRRDNRRAYPTTHPLYDTSEFDYLQVLIREDTEGTWWIYVKPHAVAFDVIETLAEPDIEPFDEDAFPERVGGSE